MIKNKNKKAQQEIVGFVLIIIIVIVIGLGFLSFTIGRPRSSHQSAEVSNLLQASMYYTVDCPTRISVRDLADLIKEANNRPDEKCSEGLSFLQVLNSTIKKILSESLMISENSPNKAYNLSIYFKPSDNPQISEILSAGGGRFANCSSVIGGSNSLDVSFPNQGIINIELEVCKGE